MNRWLPPIELAEEMQTRIANILQNLILILMVGTVISMLTYWLIAPRTYIFGALGLVLGAFGLTLILTRRGYLSAAGFLVVCVLLILVTYLLYTAQAGIRDEAAIIYPVIVIIAGIVLSGRTFTLAVLLTILSVAFIVIGEMRGLIPTTDIPPIKISYFLTFATVLTIMASAIRLMAKNLYTSLEQLKANERALAKANLELEQRVHERTSQLERSYKEMEAFSYTVSHNLRAPLRGITGFAEILMEESQADLTPTTRHYLIRISHNAQLMGQLVDDLLTYLHLAKRELKRRPVNPTESARAALTDLSPRPINEIHIHTMPNVLADPALLERVYFYLLENALKFSQHRPTPHIEVGSLEKDQTTVYFVRDNGIGFEMQYASKIFGMFERLHLEEEYEGTGVGLAIVQRILEKHRGQIWVEAAPDQGATFFFTLPETPRK